jgi:hypothetical protein
VGRLGSGHEQTKNANKAEGLGIPYLYFYETFVTFQAESSGASVESLSAQRVGSARYGYRSGKCSSLSVVLVSLDEEHSSYGRGASQNSKIRQVAFGVGENTAYGRGNDPRVEVVRSRYLGGSKRKTAAV